MRRGVLNFLLTLKFEQMRNIMIFSVIFIGILSCNQIESEDFSIDNNNNQFKVNWILTEENLQNSNCIFAINSEFNEIGISHNSLLEEFFDLTNNLEDLESYSAISFLNQPENIISSISFPLDSILSPNQFDFYDFVESYPYFSQGVKLYTMKLLDHIYDGLNIDSLNALQFKVVNDPNLLDFEVEALEIGIIIALYSNCYWTSNFGNWSQNRSAWGDIVGADAIGGVATAICLGLGVAFPPAGVTAGAVVAGTAFASSAATGIWKAGSWVVRDIGRNTGWW